MNGTSYSCFFFVQIVAIYNIAGINGGGYSDLTTMEEWRRVFEVNFFG